MQLLLLALACDTSDTTPDPTKPADPEDTAAEDTADTGDTADTDTAGTTDTADTASPADADGDGHLTPDDCDDTDARVHPGAAESCDGVDDNCDGAIDEGYGSVALLLEGPGDGSVTNATWYGYDVDDRFVLYGGDPDQDGVLNSYVRYEWAGGFQVAEDRSNDGVTLATRLEYDRDAAGTITEGRYDGDGDGAWDWSYGYVYDADGRMTEYWNDTGADGTREYGYGYTFDADGNMVYAWEETDGAPGYEREGIYVYDGDHLVSGSLDNDGDGVFETTLTNTWEGERLVEELVTGGTYPYRRTYGYTDGDDLADTSDYDAGDDGTIDWRYTTTWADDRIVAQTTDEGADGIDVYAYTYTYDAEGRGTGATSAIDGTLTSISEYAYHENGLTAAIRNDNNADGTWDVVSEYDTWGNSVYHAYDLQPDGVNDSVQVWAYDARGRRTGATTDTWGDGTLEFEQVLRDPYACGER